MAVRTYRNFKLEQLVTLTQVFWDDPVKLAEIAEVLETRLEPDAEKLRLLITARLDRMRRDPVAARAEERPNLAALGFRMAAALEDEGVTEAALPAEEVLPEKAEPDRRKRIAAMIALVVLLLVALWWLWPSREVVEEAELQKKPGEEIFEQGQPRQAEPPRAAVPSLPQGRRQADELDPREVERRLREAAQREVVSRPSAASREAPAPRPREPGSAAGGGGPPRAPSPARGGGNAPVEVEPVRLDCYLTDQRPDSCAFPAARGSGGATSAASGAAPSGGSQASGGSSASGAGQGGGAVPSPAVAASRGGDSGGGAPAASAGGSGAGSPPASSRAASSSPSGGSAASSGAASSGAASGASSSSSSSSAAAPAAAGGGAASGGGATSSGGASSAASPPAASTAAAPPSPPPPAAQPDPDCPEPAEAGRIVVIFDGSISMGLPLGVDPAREDELDEGTRRRDPAAREAYRALLRQPGPKRMGRAQDAFASASEALPEGIDIGLVVFQECRDIRQVGIFEAARRWNAIDYIYGLVPRGRTPLADSLLAAGGMLGEGKSSIVLVTDGREFCNGDPCASAKAIKEKSPGTTIHVVDITGQARAECVANLTGGRLYQPSEMEDLARVVTLAFRGAAQQCKQ